MDWIRQNLRDVVVARTMGEIANELGIGSGLGSSFMDLPEKDFVALWELTLDRLVEVDALRVQKLRLNSKSN